MADAMTSSLDRMMSKKWTVETVSRTPPIMPMADRTLRNMLDQTYDGMDVSKLCVVIAPSRYNTYYAVKDWQDDSLTVRIRETKHRLIFDGRAVELLDFGFRYRLHVFLPQYPNFLLALGAYIDLPKFRFDQDGVVSDKFLRTTILKEMDVPFSVHIDLDHPDFARPIFYSERDAMAYRLMF